ncbi:hypothetical protein BZA77DRAFT_378310 [Pyronema omphalodes]|nr:hypothetical protein BZA77DRAFT_378310 [Pyronema omphalodes]
MSGPSSSKAAIDKAASKEAFLRQRQRLAELEWERAQAQGDAFDGDDDDDGLHVPETQLPSLDIDGSASEIEDVAGKNAVIATSEGSKSGGKRAPYKLRKTLAARMGLDPKDTIGIRERRDYLRMLCARRNQPLNKPFMTFDQNVMYKLIKIVAPEMKELYGSCWTSKLTRDVIHALCLDKVRNDKARQRQLAAKAILPMSQPAGTSGGGIHTQEAVLQEEELDFAEFQDEEEDFQGQEEAESEEEEVPGYRKRAPGTIPKTHSIKTTTHADVDTLSIYIVDNEIIRMPVIQGFEGFMTVVSDVLAIGESDTVFYRPADGPVERLVWRPLSVQEEFSRLLDLCGDGVVVKVVPANDEEFHSEDEGREKVVELPVDSKTWNKKQNNNPTLPIITPDGPQPAAAQGKRKSKGKERAVDDAVVEKRPRGRPRKHVAPAPNQLPTTRAGRATRLSQKASDAAASKAAKQQDDKIADIRRDIRNQKASFRIDE